MALDTSNSFPDEEPHFELSKYLSLYSTSKYSNELNQQIVNMVKIEGFTPESIKSFRCLIHIQIYAFTQFTPDRGINSGTTGVFNINYDRTNKIITFEHFGANISINLYTGDKVSDKIDEVKKLVASIRNKNPKDFVISSGKKEGAEGNQTTIITSSTGIVTF